MRILFLTVALSAISQCQNVYYRIDPYAGSDYAGDGRSALSAPLIQPQGLAADRDGSIILADAADNRIRRITADGIIHTLTTDVQSPYGVAIGPNRDVYIADLGNHRVRLVTTDGTAKTFVSGDLVQPRNVAVDARGVVYISDFGADKVYRVASDGVLRVIAGDDSVKGPAGLAIDFDGALYIADSGNQRVVKLLNGQMTTVLENFGIVTSIAIDGTGSLYAAGGDRVAVVSAAGEISTLNVPADEVAIDATGRLLTVAYKQVRSNFAGATKILAGNRQGAFAGDGGPPEEWRFHRPTGIARDEAGNLYVADAGNGRVRKISIDKELSTVAVLEQPSYFAFDFNNFLYVSDSKSNNVYKSDPLGELHLFTKGTGAKPFRTPSGLGFDNRGDLFVADTGNNLIRKVTPDAYVSIVAGGGASDQDGFALGLALKAPIGIAVAPDGTVWFTETGKLRKLSREGRVTTVLASPLVDPRGIRVEPEGSVLVADAGTHRILRVEPEGSWKALAGSGEPGLSEILLNGATDILPEQDGTILVADTLNARIRRLTPTKEMPSISLAPVRLLHGGTDRPDPIVPGQIARLESDEPIPEGEIQILFDALRAEILSRSGNKITFVVPPSAKVGANEVIVANASGPWAFTIIQLASIAPALMGPILNENGIANSIEAPATRMSSVTLTVTGEGISANPNVIASIGGFDSDVLVTARKAGLLTLSVRVPGGFLPSGVLPLNIEIDGVKLLQEKTIVCR